MKTLQSFKSQPLMEETDYSKFDILARAGLVNKAQLSRIHRILDKMKEEHPQFNNADRMIIQNLFNRMCDLLTNNKTILQQARRDVKEDFENIDPILIESTTDISEDPPYVLLLKRKYTRMYPDRTKVALYYNQKLDKYFSVPYGPQINAGSIQAEETQLEESVMNHLYKIASGDHPTNRVKFADGSTRKIDHYTASAITQVHKAVNDENKKKLEDMVHKSPAHLVKIADFAFKQSK